MNFQIIKNLHSIIRYRKNQIFIKPHNLLQQYISHYTICFPTKIAETSLTIIPDASGCFIFTFYENRIESKMWGTMTKTTAIKGGMEDYILRVFIEFLPSGLLHFTGESQADLVDKKIQLWQVNRVIHTLVAQAYEKAEDLDNFLDMLNSILISYIIDEKPSLIAINAIEELKASKGTISVKELSLLSNYSERHLNRIFNDQLGMNVKTFSKIARINNAIQIMKNNKIILSALAQDSGFYDEAHFIHDFKSICGVTPKAYLSNMSDFYNEVFKF